MSTDDEATTGPRAVDDSGRVACRLCTRRIRLSTTLADTPWWDCCWPCARSRMSGVKA